MWRENIYMLFAGWEVRMVKNCDRGLENAARGRRPRAAFSGPRSQFFTIRTDPKPANNMFIFFSALNWFYRVQMGLFTQLLSLNRLARHLLTICKKSWQRTSDSDSIISFTSSLKVKLWEEFAPALTTRP